MRISGSRTASRRRSRGASFSPSRSRAATGGKYRVTGRPVPARSRAPSREEGRRRFDLPEDGPGAARLRRQSGGAQPERARGRQLRRRPGPLSFTSPVSATTRSCAPRVLADDYRLVPFTRRLRRRARRGRPRALPRGRLRVGARRCREAGDPRPLPVRDGRPPGEERPLFRAGGRGDRRPGDRARPRARARALAARRSAPTAEMGEAMLAVARPHAADEIAEELIALAT